MRKPDEFKRGNGVRVVDHKTHPEYNGKHGWIVEAIRTPMDTTKYKMHIDDSSDAIIYVSEDEIEHSKPGPPESV